MRLINPFAPGAPVDVVGRTVVQELLLAQTPLMFGVRPSVMARLVQEFVSLAKAKPGQVRYGSAGQGTITHLSGELFKSVAKIE